MRAKAGLAPLFKVSIWRKVVSQRQAHRDVERNKANQADKPQTESIHETGPRVAQSICQHSAHTGRFTESRKVPKFLILLVSAEGLEPSTP